MSEHNVIAPTLAILRAQREEILALAAKYGVSNVRVFGSVARGEAGPGSDVDLLVTAGPAMSVFDLVGLWLDLRDLLGQDVSLITDDVDARHQAFLDAVSREALAL